MLHIQVSGQVGFGVAKADAVCVFVRRLPRYRFPLAPLSHGSDLQRRRRRRSFPLLLRSLRFPFKATLVTPEFRFAPPGKLSSYFQTSVASKQQLLVDSGGEGKEEEGEPGYFSVVIPIPGLFLPSLKPVKNTGRTKAAAPACLMPRRL